MSFNFSKSKFVSACAHCNKYAWLDKYKPSEKAPVSEFTQSLFDNGHRVGELAKEYFKADVDVTAIDDDGRLNLSDMLLLTEKHIKLGTKAIAEASFNHNGLFCSVDILARKDDGSYDIFEVKSSKREKITKKKPTGVKEKYLLDASYQRYVLENCGINVNRVYVVMLNPDYIRGKALELNEYFVKCDVTAETLARQGVVADKLKELAPVISNPIEPETVICDRCNKCDYFAYCGKDIPTPSPFDIYNMDFPVKRKFYEAGASFFDVLKLEPDLNEAAKLQIEYYNRPEDTYIDKASIKDFLDNLLFPLYSLDFETYQAIVPEFEGLKASVQIPFQYSLHIMKKPDGDYSEGGADIEEKGFLDISGGDPRRAIAESLVENIPYGACVVAYNCSTERSIVKRLAEEFDDLADHLLSFVYRDPLDIFRKGYYYNKRMGGSFSLKSVAPAMYPDDPKMDYHNLEGSVKNGTQAMNSIARVKELSDEEKEKLRIDLEKYCALDTYAVVKILKKLYEVCK